MHSKGILPSVEVNTAQVATQIQQIARGRSHYSAKKHLIFVDCRLIFSINKHAQKLSDPARVKYCSD